MRGYRFPAYDTPLKRAARVAVFGGGNVAMDSARTALRLGADEVHIVYRRSRAEMPARAEEVENAEEEGVIFDFLTLPVRLIGDEHGWLDRRSSAGGWSWASRTSRAAAGPSRSPAPSSACRSDASVCAIGNSPNPLIPMTTPGLEVGKRGTIEVDEETGRTSRERGLGRRRRRHRGGHGDQRHGRRPPGRAGHARDARRRPVGERRR